MWFLYTAGIHIIHFSVLQESKGSVWSFWTSLWIRTTYISSGEKVQYVSHINTDQTIHLHIILDLHCFAASPLVGFSCLHALPCAAYPMQNFIGLYVTGNVPSAHTSLEICFFFFSFKYEIPSLVFTPWGNLVTSGRELYRDSTDKNFNVERSRPHKCLIRYRAWTVKMCHPLW